MGETRMVRHVLLIAVALVTMASAKVGEAQCLQNFWHNVCRDYERNHMWPSPFIESDRQAVAAPFGMMVQNGWRRQNLLSDHHFDENQELTKAGQMRVRWVLTQAPAQHRMLFVQRGLSPEETAARRDSVQQSAVRVLRDGDLPEVVETDMVDEGWSAETIDSVNQKVKTTRPDPKLPATSREKTSD